MARRGDRCCAVTRGLTRLTAASLALLLPVALWAQNEARPVEPPPGFPALGTVIPEFPLSRGHSLVVTLDQDRIFSDSRFGRRVTSELAEASRALSLENRAIETELIAEEQSLTERRATLSNEEFRALADAFDERVVGLRAAQDAKARALQARDEAERQAFSRAALPVLRDLVVDLGAVAILDARAVLFADQSIDVTSRAIARIDARIGDGLALSPEPRDLPSDPDLSVDDGPPGDGDGVGLDLDRSLLDDATDTLPSIGPATGDDLGGTTLPE